MTRQEHGYGSRLSGFTFGKDDLVARIYDKTLESAVTGKTWPELLWTGRAPDLPVWRVEFQYRRPVLAALGLTGMGDVICHREDDRRGAAERLPGRDLVRLGAVEWGVAAAHERSAPLGRRASRDGGGGELQPAPRRTTLGPYPDPRRDQGRAQYRRPRAALGRDARRHHLHERRQPGVLHDLGGAVLPVDGWELLIGWASRARRGPGIAAWAVSATARG